MIFNLPEAPAQIQSELNRKDGEYVQNLKRLIVGSGDQVMKADQNGLFLGNANFADAPFSVTYAGVMTISSGGGSVIPFNNISAGTNANVLNVGVANVKIDGANKRIIINDGTNDRVLIGYLSGGF